MDDTAGLYDFDNEEKIASLLIFDVFHNLLANLRLKHEFVPYDEGKFDLKKVATENWIEPAKQERKRKGRFFKHALRPGVPAKPREPHIPRMPQSHDFQIFNTQRLTELFEKEVRFHLSQKNQAKDAFSENDMEEVGEAFTTEEQEEKDQLLEERFANWTRRDFNAFVIACEIIRTFTFSSNYFGVFKTL